MFFHMIDFAIVNANILYNSKSEKKMSQLDFRISLITGLLEGHALQPANHYHNPNTDLPRRLTERHFLEEVPSDTPYGGRPQCEVCRVRGKRSQTRYRCKQCETPLHPILCMEIYHTKLHYDQ